MEITKYLLLLSSILFIWMSVGGSDTVYERGRTNNPTALLAVLMKVKVKF